MSIADWLGIYGAILATGLAVFEVFKYIRERPCLKVRTYFAGLTITFVVPGRTVRYRSESVPTGNDPFLAFRITNPRGVPNNLVRVGGTLRDGDEFELTYDPVTLPRRLEPGDSVDFAGDPNVVSGDLSYLAVWDTSGRKWKVPRWNLLIVKVQAGVAPVNWRWLKRLAVYLAQREARR